MLDLRNMTLIDVESLGDSCIGHGSYKAPDLPDVSFAKFCPPLPFSAIGSVVEDLVGVIDRRSCPVQMPRIGAG